jgi:hypothetical protein
MKNVLRCIFERLNERFQNCVTDTNNAEVTINSKIDVYRNETSVALGRVSPCTEATLESTWPKPWQTWYSFPPTSESTPLGALFLQSARLLYRQNFLSNSLSDRHHSLIATNLSIPELKRDTKPVLRSAQDIYLFGII